MVIHVLDEGLTHRIGDFQQNLAVTVGLDQIPHHQPLLARQCFEDIGHIRRMQRIEQRPDFFQVLCLKLRIPLRCRRGAARLFSSLCHQCAQLVVRAQQVRGTLKRIVHIMHIGTGVSSRFHSASMHAWPRRGATRGAPDFMAI